MFYKRCTLFVVFLSCATPPAPQNNTGAEPQSSTLTPQALPVAPKPKPVIDLRVDTNRDGKLDTKDEAGEDTWDKTHGAIFLANLDDDELRCPKSGRDSTLPNCNDAADDTINGEADLLDLAPVSVLAWPDAPANATAKLTLDAASAQRVKLFKGETRWDMENDTLSVDDLKSGTAFWLEGVDIVRDASKWAGFVDLTLTVEAGAETIGEDTVRLRVAPVITFHHLLPAQEAFATRMRSDPSASDDFLTDLRDATAEAKVPRGLYEIEVDDQWTQDFFETGYMAMPAANGAQHVLYVAYRSANRSRGGGDVLRSAGKFVFTDFRGKDRVGIQQYSTDANKAGDSLNSFGNFETIPPYGTYPLGRVLRGAVRSRHPDKSFTMLIDSQNLQPAIEIDTSWLAVGHVDETLSFVKANNARGWVVLVNDARAAKTMLEKAQAEGHGAAKMFTGKTWGWNESADISIDDVLNDADIMAASADAAAQVDGQLTKLKAELGLTDDEIIRIPYLHQPAGSGSVAFQPGTVNGIYLADDLFAAPDPHGPFIDGKDIMKDQFERALAPLGIRVRWIENWDLYHTQMGEVHCGSNVVRAIPETKWWETGR